VADAAQAAALYRQGCDGGNAPGCTNLGFLYETGTGVVADAAQAAALYRQGCDGGNAVGCFNLGAMAYNQTPRDRETARDHFTTACALDPSHQACGLVDRMTREIEEAAEADE
jgi:TPR repeat protein